VTQQSQSFALLDPRIQRFIWSQGWETLRDAQEAAIPPILAGDRDVIVAAATAAGKTEAAFLPALTHLLQAGEPRLIVYISPLKALINDQFGRLQLLCDDLGVPVWPWHGDVQASIKRRFKEKHHGVLLITPESLEAMFCNQGPMLRTTMNSVSFVVIDELHAFIGSERGKQLQSLMHRLEILLQRRVPRIGLSATLGDMGLAAQFLRPGGEKAVKVVVGASGVGALKILLKGFLEPSTQPAGAGQGESLAQEVPDQKMRGAEPIEDVDGHDADDLDLPDPREQEVAPGSVAEHLFGALRGTNNLVFPNSRAGVERYTNLLSKLCERERIPNEFWPHHGSLSKEIRADTEAALKNKQRSATAVCTNTLELGIDIGAVVSVAQIGPPPSVASLRQRLGRSGRRKGEAAILRGYSIEREQSSKARLEDELRLDTVLQIAMIELLLEGWFEPPRAGGLHLSTLVQQILSAVAQHGGASIAQLFALLCGQDAPFQGLSKADFMALVKELGQRELLMLDGTGLLLHGRIGEAMVNNFRFYAAFRNDEEYRLLFRGRTLGTLPVTVMVALGDRMLFAGRTWRIEAVDTEAMTISLAPARGGAPPVIMGQGARHHTRVIQRVRQLLSGTEVPVYLDPMAQQLLSEARAGYIRRELDQQIVLDTGGAARLVTWLGDDANEALVCMLRSMGLQAQVADLGVCLEPQAVDAQRRQVIAYEELTEMPREQSDLFATHQGRIEQIAQALLSMASEPPQPVDKLLADCQNMQREKWDWALPQQLLARSYASLNMDLDQARQWVLAKLPSLLAGSN
jgi:ATP-dependent Lhr-like helicase